MSTITSPESMRIDVEGLKQAKQNCNCPANANARKEFYGLTGIKLPDSADAREMLNLHLEKRLVLPKTAPKLMVPLDNMAETSKFAGKKIIEGKLVENKDGLLNDYYNLKKKGNNKTIQESMKHLKQLARLNPKDARHESHNLQESINHKNLQIQRDHNMNVINSKMDKIQETLRWK